MLSVFFDGKSQLCLEQNLIIFSRPIADPEATDCTTRL